MGIEDIVVAAKKKAIRPTPRAQRPAGNTPPRPGPIDIGGGSLIIPGKPKGGSNKKKKR